MLHWILYYKVVPVVTEHMAAVCVLCVCSTIWNLKVTRCSSKPAENGWEWLVATAVSTTAASTSSRPLPSAAWQYLHWHTSGLPKMEVQRVYNGIHCFGLVARICFQSRTMSSKVESVAVLDCGVAMGFCECIHRALLSHVGSWMSSQGY